MTKRHLLLGLLAAIAGLILPGVVQTQGPPPGPPPGGRGGPPPLRLADVKWQPWNNTGLTRLPTDVGPDGPAPKRELTGLWDPARNGIGARGARNPAPLTPWGDAVGKTHKSGDGIRQVDVAEINDPLSTVGDPSGYPRNLLFELRSVNFVRTPSAYYALHMWERRWRAIWTDGRSLPTDPDPRWYGYSVGRWEDDYTFVVTSNGTDERTWLDNAGNPHSDQLRVEERWHRISEKRLELTVTLDDPKAYTRPWVALDKLQFFLIPDSVDLIEMMNVASEVQAVAANYRKEAVQK
jgi:hypothetical protein